MGEAHAVVFVMIELLYLPINRYGDHGELIEEPAGYMTSGGMSNEEAESYVHAGPT